MRIKFSFVIVLVLIAALLFLLRDHIHFGGIEPEESLTIEFGEKLPSVKDYYSKDDPYATIKYKFNDIEVDSADFVGTYDVEITTGFNKTYKSELYVQDTTPPVLALKVVSIKAGSKYSADDFVSSVTDLSHCTITFRNAEMGEYKEKGVYNIRVTATDDYNNSTTEQTTLYLR